MPLVVFNMSKIQNERKSQLKNQQKKSEKSCVQHVKDTKWKEITTACSISSFSESLCSTCQRYKMKGNHNFIYIYKKWNKLCSTCQRYKMKGNHNLLSSHTDQA